LPLKVFGDLEQKSLEETLATMLGAWHVEQARFPHTANRQSVRLQEGAVVLEDWIDHLRGGDVQPNRLLKRHLGAPLPGWNCNPATFSSKFAKDYFARPEKLLGAWVRTLAIAASGARGPWHSRGP
jgi:hypothetical protein